MLSTCVLYLKFKNNVIQGIIGNYSLKRFNCEYKEGLNVRLCDNYKYQVLIKDSVLFESNWFVSFENDAGIYFPVLKHGPSGVIFPSQKEIDHIYTTEIKCN